MQAEEIASIPLFAALAPAEQERVASVSRALRFEAGAVIVNEGEFAFDFYALTRGSADVLRAGVRIASLGPGDVFGEMGVVPREPGRWTRRRNASVVITAPTDAIAIEGREFRRLADEIPALHGAIRAMAAGRDRAPQ